MDNDIAVHELLGELIEMVELIAADASAQKSWLVGQRYPIDEIALQYLDAFPGWSPRLSAAGLLTPVTDASLRALRDAVLRAFENRALWISGGLGLSGWADLRDQARETAALLSQPRPASPADASEPSSG